MFPFRTDSVTKIQRSVAVTTTAVSLLHHDGCLGAALAVARPPTTTRTRTLPGTSPHDGQAVVIANIDARPSRQTQTM